MIRGNDKLTNCSIVQQVHHEAFLHTVSGWDEWTEPSIIPTQTHAANPPQAFCWHRSSDQNVVWRHSTAKMVGESSQKIDTAWLTTVGTEEVGLSSCSTAAPLIGMANWYMERHAVCTTSYNMLRAWLIHCARSWTWPMRSVFTFGIKQLGQGQSPLSCIVARRTLHDHWVSTKIPVTQWMNVLLWIISWVCENAWVHTPFTAINALNNMPYVYACKKSLSSKKYQIACITSLWQWVRMSLLCVPHLQWKVDAKSSNESAKCGM